MKTLRLQHLTKPFTAHHVADGSPTLSLERIRAALEKSDSQVGGDHLAHFPVQIVLNAIHVGTASEGLFHGPKGEFYWHSIISDGNDIVLYDSAKANGAEPIEKKVKAGQWLGVEDVTLYYGQEPPKRGSLAVAFRLLENDDMDDAEKIFRGLAGVGTEVVRAVAAAEGAKAAEAAEAAAEGSEAAAEAAEAAELAELVSVLSSPSIEEKVVDTAIGLMELDDDDPVIQRKKGLNGLTEHYLMGRYFTLRSRHSPSSFAVFSVLPTLESGVSDEDFFWKHDDNPDRPAQDYIIEAPRDGIVSFFARRDTAASFVPFVLTNIETGETMRFTKAGVKSFRVEEGEHKFRLISTMDYEVSYMFTAFDDHLAKDTFA